VVSSVEAQSALRAWQTLSRYFSIFKSSFGRAAVRVDRNFVRQQTKRSSPSARLTSQKTTTNQKTQYQFLFTLAD
ncbi:MAG TPA: hypothetical protein VIK24_04045, partial [Pyrinomonadaceae bacterium]